MLWNPGTNTTTTTTTSNNNILSIFSEKKGRDQLVKTNETN